MKNASATGEPGPPLAPVAAAIPSVPEIDAQERHRRICEAAYFQALARDFAGDRQIEDWLAAEREIDAMLLAESQPPAHADRHPQSGLARPRRR